MYKICYWFFFFMIYSFIGYLTEIICCSINNKKLIVNRGFCLGPYLPIYGFSSVIMNIFLAKYSKDIITLFVMSAFVCTLMEYMTSLILEKIFHARWWDYTEKKFNLSGRVCLENSCLFGLGGVFIVSILHPFLDGLVSIIPYNVLIILSIVLFVMFMIDVIITVTTMCQVKIAATKFTAKDATEEISRKVRNEIIKNKGLMLHMLNAFPKIELSNHDPLGRIKNYLAKQREEYKKLKEKSKRK